jgi:hypothetical protein
VTVEVMPGRRAPGEVHPYRVEWRANLSTRWMWVGDEPTRPEADELAQRTLTAHGGYCRLLSQHVIATSQRPGAWEAAT